MKKKVEIKIKEGHTVPHILFVCGRNKWRSPTAERIYKKDTRIDVRSAGMSEKSRHTISKEDVEWADLILVMESKYKSWIKEKFRDLALPEIENLKIPDQYEYMDENLIDLLHENVEYQLKRFEE